MYHEGNKSCEQIETLSYGERNKNVTIVMDLPFGLQTLILMHPWQSTVRDDHYSTKSSMGRAQKIVHCIHPEAFAEKLHSSNQCSYTCTDIIIFAFLCSSAQQRKPYHLLNPILTGNTKLVREKKSDSFIFTIRYQCRVIILWVGFHMRLPGQNRIETTQRSIGYSFTETSTRSLELVLISCVKKECTISNLQENRELESYACVCLIYLLWSMIGSVNPSTYSRPVHLDLIHDFNSPIPHNQL